MTKNKLRKINLAILIVSLIFVIIFLILSNNYKDNVILWFFSFLTMISFILTIKEFCKEIKENDILLTKEKMLEILRLYWEKDKSTIFIDIFNMIVFIYCSIILEYGYLCIPFIVYLFTNSLVKAINKFVAKTNV